MSFAKLLLRTAFIVLPFTVAFNLWAKNLLKYWYPSLLAWSVSSFVPDLSRFPIVISPPSTAATLYLVDVLPVNKLFKEPDPKPNLVSILLFILVSIPPTVVNPVALFKLNATTSSECTFIFVPEFNFVGKVEAPKSTSKAVELPYKFNSASFKSTSPFPSEYTA